MDVERSIFRLYDIRGIVGTEIVEDFAFGLGKGYGTIVRRKGGKRLAVGSDVRPSSGPLKEALSDGLRSVGVSVVDIGTVPTPLLYFSLFVQDVQGGIQVTASHNPTEYNGFKLNLGRDTFFGDDIQDLMKLMEKDDFDRTFEKGMYETKDIVGDYVEEVEKRVQVERRVNVAFDPGNGTAGPVLCVLMPALGQEVRGIYLEPDGTFPNHLADPTVEKYMKDLQALVKDEGYELGVGLDGDTDRIGAVDETGQLLYGDRLLGLYASQVLAERPGSEIVFDVKCSQGLVEHIESLGGRPVMWKTGHSLLKAKLRETGAPLAGEMSGHMFFNDRYYGYDDGLYSTARLLEILSRSDRGLRDLASEMPSYVSTPEIHARCPDEEKFEVVDKLVNSFKDRGYEVIDLDGARVQFDDGFGLVRASNTQPVLVLRFEGKTEERMQEIRGLVLDEMRKHPEIDLEGIDP
jgi:phosphomannomutase/phosphoglucomutase